MEKQKKILFLFLLVVGVIVGSIGTLSIKTLLAANSVSVSDSSDVQPTTQPSTIEVKGSTDSNTNNTGVIQNPQPTTAPTETVTQPTSQPQVPSANQQGQSNGATENPCK